MRRHYPLAARPLGRLHAIQLLPPCAVPQAVKGMPSEAVIGRWKETVRELGNILVQVSGGDQGRSACMRADGRALQSELACTLRQLEVCLHPLLESVH